jgi:uncharacterized SAM-binding protein YcdF (DUF218 family)
MDNPLISLLLSGWLLPPLNSLLLLALGLLTLGWRRGVALTLLTLGVVLLYVSSAPIVAVATVRALEGAALAHPKQTGAQAIVVLGAGTYVDAPEYGQDVPTAGGLVRVRYAAHLQRATGLPVLTTGGAIWGAQVPEGEQMRRVLEDEFRVPVRWVEPTGTTTWSSAIATRAILQPQGVRTILLVTHAWHMRRAQLAFEQAGFKVIPAPTAFTTYSAAYPPGFLPEARALELTRDAWREGIGLGWYRMRARLGLAGPGATAPRGTLP